MLVRFNIVSDIWSIIKRANCKQIRQDSMGILENEQVIKLIKQGH